MDKLDKRLLPKKTVKIEDWQAVIMVNSKPAVCPYVTRLLVPGQIQGSANISGSTCGSHCALFDVQPKGYKFIVGTCQTSMELDQWQEIPKEEASIKAILNTGFNEH